VRERYVAWRARREAQRAAATEAHRNAAADVIQEVAASALASGAATLSVGKDPFYGDHVLRLVPSNARAAPVMLHADWSGTYLHVGHDECLHELWQPTVEERRRLLRACVVAVVAGRYDEVTECAQGHSKLTMTFRADDGDILVRHHSTCDASEPPVERVTYEAYESTTPSPRSR
jgi:hypothetical protein